MNSKISLVILACIILGTAGGAFGGDESMVARVNGVGISQTTFDQNWNSFIQSGAGSSVAQGSPDQLSAKKREILDRLIDHELLWQETKAKKFLVDEKKVSEETNKNYPSREAFLKLLKENNLTEAGYNDFMTQVLSIQNMIDKDIAKDVSVSDKEVHDFYTSNPDMFKTPEQVHARHILIKVDPGADQATKEAARKKIRGILEEARAGADFAELARKHSDCPSKQNGGDLGLFSRGQMVKPFEDAAFATRPGTITDVVETQFGYHLIKVEERKNASVLSEKDMNERIKLYLKSQKTNQAVRDHLKVLRDKAKIEILKNL